MNLNEVNEEMSTLKGWFLEASVISKNFPHGNFKEALEFVNKVGEIAEKHNHHPDLIVSHNRVKVLLTTHSIGGLSKADFEVAREIDKIEQSNDDIKQA